MDGTKRWWTSKTIWGSVITVAGLALGIFGIELDPATQALVVDQLTLTIVGAVELVGIVVTIVGRAAADKKLTI